MESSTNFFVVRDFIRDSLAMANDSDNIWTDAVLYTPYQCSQVLMYEYAECVAIRAFFKMLNLHFQLEQRPNAEFVSPNGKVPFLRLQKSLVAQFSPIVEFVANKGIRLSSTLTDIEKADHQAYISLIEEILTNALIYFAWNDPITYKLVTKGRYASVFLWPLNLWMPALKRREMLTYLRDNEWAYKTSEEVIKQCDKCFQALSIKLGKNLYFFGQQPTELDALAFGHLFTIITTKCPDERIKKLLMQHSNLIQFCTNINEKFFSQNKM